MQNCNCKNALCPLCNPHGITCSESNQHTRPYIYHSCTCSSGYSCVACLHGLKEHKNRQIDENRKVSRRLDELKNRINTHFNFHEVIEKNIIDQISNKNEKSFQALNDHLLHFEKELKLLRNDSETRLNECGCDYNVKKICELSERMRRIEEHKNRQIDENRKVSIRLDDIDQRHKAALEYMMVKFDDNAKSFQALNDHLLHFEKESRLLRNDLETRCFDCNRAKTNLSLAEFNE